jgi:hypothetical protein
MAEAVAVSVGRSFTCALLTGDMGTGAVAFNRAVCRSACAIRRRESARGRWFAFWRLHPSESASIAATP